MEPDQAFLAITDAIGGLDTAMEKNIAATTIFGGRYAQQITGALDQAGGSLTNLTDAFEASGNAMTGEQINKLKAYSDHLTDFDFATKKLTADMLVGFLPMMTELADMFISGVNGAKEIADAFGGIEEVVKTLTIVIAAMTIAKVVDLAVTGQLSIATGILTIAKIKLAAAAFAAKMAIAGPVGLAAAAGIAVLKVIELTKAMNDANESMKANEEATRLAAEGNSLVGDLMLGTMTAVGNGAELSAEQVVILTNRINAMGADSETTAAAIGLLNAQLDGSTESMELATINASQLTRKTDELTLAMLDEAAAALEAEVAIARLNLKLKGGSDATVEAIRRSVAEAERLRAIMLDIKAGPNEGRDLPTGGGIGTGIIEPEAIDEYKVSLKEIHALDQQAMAEHLQRVAENTTSEKDTRLEGIRAIAAAQDASDRARQDALDKANADMASFSQSAIQAAMGGTEAWNSFWANMRQKIAATVATKGFMTLLNFATGGMGGGILGTVGGWLGFKGGGSVPHSPYQAAGGMTVPGSPTTNGDKTIIAAESGEVVLSRNQAQDLKGGGNVTHVAVDYRPAFSSASAADVSRIVPLIKKAMEKGGIIAT